MEETCPDAGCLYPSSAEYNRRSDIWGSAVHVSPTTAYLSPPGKEPQQRYSSHPHSHQRDERHQHDSSYHHPTPTRAAHTSKPNRSSPPPRSASPPTPYPIPKDEFIHHQYASDHILQSHTVYVPSSADAHSQIKKYWIIYLHGGYYRDPLITSSTFNPLLSTLLHHPTISKSVSPQIAGYASINYRLSPHPEFPQDPDKTSNYELRNAKHPDHINDVLTAIADLQRRYGFESNYVLIGHSVGATLALQTALAQSIPWSPLRPSSSPSQQPDEATNETTTTSPLTQTLSTASTLHPDTYTSTQTSTASARHQNRQNPSQPLTIHPPTSIVSLNGIHSFPLIHDTNPSYEPVSRNAFPERNYDSVSPASYPASAYHPALKHVYIAASKSDSLVPWSQVDALESRLSPPSVSSSLSPAANGNHATTTSCASSIRVKTVEIHGDHNDSWKCKGHDAEVGMLVARALRDLR